MFFFDFLIDFCRIAINKETPVAPPTPQAKASQLLSMLKPKKKDTSEINSPTALSPTATTLVLTTAAAVASTSTSNGTSTSASASASVTATLGVESKAATLMSALKIGSSAKEKGTENAPLNINNSNNNSNYNNTNSCSDAGIAVTINHTTTSGKAAQLLSILKSPSNNSSTKSATVTAPISANAVISGKIASSTQPIEQTNVAMDESRRAELMLKMIKPRNTSVEDLLTDVDIAAKVKEAATAPSATSTASTAADAKVSTSRCTSTAAPVNVRTPSPVLTGSTKSAKSTSSKEDALMRIILQSTSAATAATTVSAASSSGSAPVAPSSLKSVSSSVKAPSPVPPLGGSLPPRPVTDRNQAGSPLASCLLTSNLRTASSRNLRSPSASPILAGIPGPGLSGSGSGNVSQSSPAPVSWASLSNNNIAAAASATTTATSLAGGAAGGGVGGIGKSHSMGNISSTASSAPMLISPSDLLRAKAATPTFTPTATSTR